MALILTIENETSLPNGAPVSVRLTDRRNFDIGRGAHLDWTLPDPTRFISGKHCELRYRDDGYWVYDVSTNGTFLNDSPRRLQAPHRVRNGDRLTIGSYVILVTVEDEAEEPVSELGNGAASWDKVPAEPAPSETGARSRLSPSVDLSSGPEMPKVVGPPPLWNGARVVAPAIETAEEEPAVPPTAADAEPQEPAALREYPFEARGLPSSGREDIRPVEAGTGLRQPNLSAREPRAEEDAGVRHSVPPLPPVSTRPSLAPEAKAGVVISDRPVSRAPTASVHSPVGEAETEVDQPDLDEFFRRFAAGAGIPEHVFARRDRREVAEELGVLMRLVAENLKLLLSARYEAKRFTRTASQTMIQALDNNPLKFAPTAEDALRIMLGPRTRSYLGAKASLEGAFHDLKTHQIKTFSAMQAAVKMLIDDFDPQQIDAATGPSSGIAAWLVSRKARLWDLFVARWQAKSLRHKEGLVDAFMLYFSECYDRASEKS